MADANEDDEPSDKGAARRLLVRLCAGGACAYASYAMCRSPVLPLFARSLGAAPETIGLIVGASTLTGIVVKLPAGALSDVWGRRALLLMGAIVFAVMPVSYLWVGSIGVLLLVRFAHGNATALFGPVASATVSDLAPASRRGAWLGTWSAAQGAGQAIGPVMAGWLMAGGRFDRAFLASGLFGAAALALIARWPATATAAGATGGAAARWTVFRRGILQVASDGRVLLTSLAQAAQFFLNGTLNAFLPLYAADIVGLGSLQIGLLFGIQTVTTLAVRPLFGILSDRIGRRQMICGGLVSCSLAICAVSIVSSFAPLALSAAAYGAGLSMTTSATSAYVTDLTQRARYGAAHGIFGTIYDVGDAFGPISAGILVAWIGYRQTFRVMAAVVLLFAAAFAWTSRRWERLPMDYRASSPRQ